MLQTDLGKIPYQLNVLLNFSLFKYYQRAQSLGRLAEKPVAQGVVGLQRLINIPLVTCSQVIIGHGLIHKQGLLDLLVRSVSPGHSVTSLIEFLCLLPSS